jgi:5'-AMP-activated protein kinase, catalytic alpha subunit
MDVLNAMSHYQAQQGEPAFEEFVHAAVSAQGQPYRMCVPSVFLPWDDRKGIIAMRRKDKTLAICRCGVVLAGTYFHLDVPTQQTAVALKVMDRHQVEVQKDDVDSELRVMAQLQPKGVDGVLTNQHMVRWENGEDGHNLYIATEFVANGSLVAYAHKKIRALMVSHLQDFVARHGEGPTKLECVSYVYRGAGHEWMREGIKIFEGIMRGLTYVHSSHVAHLDLDIYNVAIDKELVPRIIDLGSSQIVDHRGIAGAGYVGIKCKPIFVAPEVRSHAKLPPPRPGFDGAKADLWSAGVIVRILPFVLGWEERKTLTTVLMSYSLSSVSCGGFAVARRTSRPIQDGAKRSSRTLTRRVTKRRVCCAKTLS